MKSKKPTTIQQRSSIWLPLLAAGAIGLIVAGVLILRNPAPPTVPSPAAVEHTEETFPDIPRVNLAEAKAAFDARTAIFLDVRDASSYAAGHIPGALSIPLATLEERANELKPTDWIITYCT